MQEQGIAGNTETIETLIPLYAERSETLKQLATQVRFMFEDFEEFNANAAKKHFKISAAEPLNTLKALFDAIEDWNEATIQAAIDETMEILEIGMGKIGMPLRVAITSGGQSPSMDILCMLLGKKKCLQRIDMALDYIEQRRLQSEQR